MLTVRSVVSICSIAMTVLSVGAACGQNYPTRPIRVLATEAGAGIDALARIVAPEIAGLMGQPVVVENRPSAIQPEIAARATPDGYTVSIASGTTWLTPLIQKTSYDAIKDFSPITLLYTAPFILVVHPSVPAKTLRELIDLAKSKPGVLNIAASASPGGQSFLAAELFKSMAGVNMVRVPYKGNATAILGVLGGEADLMFIDVGLGMPQVKADKLRALAVTSLEPSPLVPGMPTMAALGLPGYESVVVAGVLAPAGTPAPIVNRLNQEFVRVLSRADIKERFFSIGSDVAHSASEQFAMKIKSEIAKWGKVLKDAGIKPEL